MKLRLLFLIASLMSAGPACAYKQSTHMRMSDKAIIASDINNDPAVMSNLGLPPYATTPKFPGSGLFASPVSITTLVQRGANEEDDGLRSLNYGYYIYFMQDPDGVWRVHEL